MQAAFALNLNARSRPILISALRLGAALEGIRLFQAGCFRYPALHVVDDMA
jgi:hypothetical protein